MPADKTPEFQDLLRRRSAGEYAAFLLPHLRDGVVLLDCGCGPGSITYGLAERLPRWSVFGLDLADGFRAVRRHAEAEGLANVAFVRADINALPYPEQSIDAVLAHSVVETLPTPSATLSELRRVLKTGGVIGLAAVDYGGLLFTGPSVDRLQNFYSLKEQVWEKAWDSAPRRGRYLRALLSEVGFRDVVASARYVSYGDQELVRQFAVDRAEECRGGAFADDALRLGLVDRSALQAMSKAWRTWGDSTDSFLAFPWCAVVGWK